MTLHEGGTLGFASASVPISAYVNGKQAEVRAEAGFYSVDCVAAAGAEALVELVF